MTTSTSNEARANTHFRSDIQGLRALAVIAVIALHAGLPLPGGFLGVDIFFVISGFVITLMLHREWQTSQRISLKNFFWRRFKRLAPALGLTVAVTVLLSAFFLSPLGDAQRTAATGLGALTVSANIVLARLTGSYFDAPAEANALLNTWSLSVEEQFYLLFPLLLIGAWILKKRHQWPVSTPILVVGLITGLSLLTALAPWLFTGLPGFDQVTRFYSPITRAWEFGFGALGALLIAHGLRLGKHLAATTWIVGLALTLASLFLISDTFMTPGPSTLFPVVGTTLLLVAGGSTPLATGALGNRPAVWIGDASYSLYLWHWPIIVFAIALWPTTWWIAIAAALVSIIPATASFLLVEKPIRALPSLSGQRVRRIALVFVVVPFVVSLAVLVTTQSLVKPRFEQTEALAGDVGHSIRMQTMNNFSFGCPFEQVPDVFQVDDGIVRCMQSKPQGTPIDVAILGDSHAEHLYPGIAEALADRNVAYQYLFDWPRRSSANSALAVDQVVTNPDITHVVLNSAWTGSEDSQSLAEAIERITETGKTVILTDDIPDFPFDAAACKYRPNLVQDRVCSFPSPDIARNHIDRLAILQELSNANSNIALVRTHGLFCDNTGCSMQQNGELLYEDDNHLNLKGSRLVGSEVGQSIANNQISRKRR